MSGATPPTASPSPRPRARARALVDRTVALTSPALLGALIGDLVLTVVRHDLVLLVVGVVLVLSSAALFTALQARTRKEAAAPTATRGTDGAQ